MTKKERENLRKSCELIASIVYEVRTEGLPEASWPYWLELIERWASGIADGGDLINMDDMD